MKLLKTLAVVGVLISSTVANADDTMIAKVSVIGSQQKLVLQDYMFGVELKYISGGEFNESLSKRKLLMKLNEALNALDAAKQSHKETHENVGRTLFTELVTYANTDENGGNGYVSLGLVSTGHLPGNGKYDMTIDISENDAKELVKNINKFYSK